jgi:hypothetical protein
VYDNNRENDPGAMSLDELRHRLGHKQTNEKTSSSSTAHTISKSQHHSSQEIFPHAPIAPPLDDDISLYQSSPALSSPKSESTPTNQSLNLPSCDTYNTSKHSKYDKIAYATSPLLKRLGIKKSEYSPIQDELKASTPAHSAPSVEAISNPSSMSSPTSISCTDIQSSSSSNTSTEINVASAAEILQSSSNATNGLRLHNIIHGRYHRRRLASDVNTNSQNTTDIADVDNLDLDSDGIEDIYDDEDNDFYERWVRTLQQEAEEEERIFVDNFFKNELRPVLQPLFYQLGYNYAERFFSWLSTAMGWGWLKEQ